MSASSPDRWVLPGDVIRDVRSSQGVTVLGPGLKQNEGERDTILVTQSGRLKFSPPNTYWLDGSRKQYVPYKGDLVVGIVFKKAGDMLRIDIGSAEYATLSLLAFEGATKKQKPDVQPGDIVYARILNAHREMEPELVCVDSYYKARTLGMLSNEGFLMNISLSLAYSLLNVENPLLRTLGKKFPFEIAIGMNGKVWIHATQTKNALRVVKALEAAEKGSERDVIDVCRQVM